MDSCAKQGAIKQGRCKISDFKRQLIHLLRYWENPKGKEFTIGKTVLRRNGGGCMDIEEMTGIYNTDTKDYFLFDKFRVGKQTIAYVIPKYKTENEK